MQTDKPAGAARAAQADANRAQIAAPVKFGAVTLTRKMTVEQAFRRIADACLAQVSANADGVAGGDDPEHVHQMRVGLRHLTSALGLFGALTALPPALQAELDWLAAQLGPARDWEVLAQSTLALVQPAEPEDISALGLPPAAAAIAQEWRAQAAAAVHAPRYRKLMESIGQWLRDGGWRTDAAPGDAARLDARIARAADKMLARGHRRLLRRG